VLFRIVITSTSSGSVQNNLMQNKSPYNAVFAYNTGFIHLIYLYIA